VPSRSLRSWCHHVRFVHGAITFASFMVKV
jgi:hypothetical protein